MIPNASCNRRSRSSGECSTKRSSASLMKRICWKRKHWKNSVFCSTTGLSPMAVVLVGQTELWENKLKLQRYAAVRQRIDMYCTLPRLDKSETEQYIASHMDYSGCTQDVFTAKALDEIHKASAGIPRMVNRICEKALMYASQNQKRLIDDYMIKFVIEHEMLGTITT